MSACQPQSQNPNQSHTPTSPSIPTINQNLPTSQIQINQKIYTIELATTPTQQQLGLQNRPELTQNQGMLFIFPDSKIRYYWMKDTLHPLDIIYLDENQIITQIYTNTPTCKSQDQSQTNCPHYPSTSPTKYVLELKAGQSKKDKIQVGDNMEIT